MVVPIALYHDRHGIFEHCKSEPESLEEQLEGRRKPTQFGRLMEELGITYISSRSPQARGRVEKLWGTFQDRLVSELRLTRLQSGFVSKVFAILPSWRVSMYNS